MKIVRSKAELREHRRPEYGFVPTMGAFHEGHLHLMRTAKAECGGCLVSLFVNPTQFGPKEDFRTYPRDEERDFALAESAGVDLVYAPPVEDVYASEPVSIVVGDIAQRWEGSFRPGHFEGVATVVAKLFHMAGAASAYFGLKDFQQCAVIRAMADGLDFDIRLRLIETVREEDGLAMSSRNRYLSPEERAAAPSLYRFLDDTRASIRKKPSQSETVLKSAISRLEDCGFRVDYLAWVDSKTLLPATTHESATRLIAAAWLGKTRLIDNCAG